MLPTRPFLVLGLCLAAGLAVFGLQVSRAVQRGRDFDRFLSVRGLSERQVKATLAIWPVRFASYAEDLPALKQTIEADKARVGAYLSRQGIRPGEISFGLPDLSDKREHETKDDASPLPRYKAVTTLVVRSAQVDRVKQAIQQADTLLDQGVTLVSGDGEAKAEFAFDQINALKPGMIQEATANARASAEKFAQDSHARVGAIRRATQGVVEIEDRDVASPEQKVVRVVTTVDFFLE